MAANKLRIRTGISGDEQEGSLMNATLSVQGDLAVSIAVLPEIPDAVLAGGQKKVKEWLKEKLAPLKAFANIEVQIGPNEEEQ